MSDIKPTFAGEMQLAGWSETHTGGCKVTFWLQSAEDLDAFRALTVRKGNTAGHRFMAALVEIGDDERPVQPIPPNSTELEKPKGGPLSILAAKWCRDPRFWQWMNETFTTADIIGNEKEAAELLRYICACESSRAELDSIERCAKRFQTYIRGPYMKHHVAIGATA